MDIIIAGALFVIAICMVFGRPLKIDLHHTYESKQNADVNDYESADDAQTKFDKKQDEDKKRVTMDDLISGINEAVMGVDINEPDR